MFITELTARLYKSFITTIVYIKVVPISIVHATEFASVCLCVKLRQFLLRLQYNSSESFEHIVLSQVANMFFQYYLFGVICNQ
jgi:hypothetical protein